MSMVYQMTSTAPSGKTAGASKSSGTSAPDGVTGTFDQTLAQSMNGGVANASTSESPESLSSNPLVFSFASLEEGEQKSLMELLSSLFDDLDSLDETLENDPTLAAELQSIIQQLYVLLNGAETGETADENETVPTEAAASSPLAIHLEEHPAAARFVLQDVLTQMAAKFTEPDGAVVKNTTELKHLLQTLQDRLDQAGVPLNSNKGWTELKSMVDAFAVVNDQTEGAQSNAGQLKSNVSGPQSNTLTLQSAMADNASEAGGSIGSGESQLDGADQNRIITAGELSLRSSGTLAAKPAEPVMQASQFSKEMTQFVINKLDIVHQKGFSEATISLRPEHLGKLDVQISIQNGQLVARFMTEHAMAKDMIEQQMSQLRTSLAAQGIQVERIEVTQNSSVGSQMYQDGGRQPGGNSREQRRSREREEQTDDSITVANLQEELRNWRSEHAEESDLPRDSFTAKA
ncbi:flagellar hook-length control protein FliK [Paenibacillus sp. FSL W8-0426]|uniref:flagellar hook-length control protein FliK n=1 Tax=Paenibacillus sp. FSL W8-0426 TaxID=2921714 RepID=UPI0030DD1C4E